MGGPKNCGQVQTENKYYSASKSQVNFVIPDRKIITEQNKIVQKETPGIITQIIDSVSQNDPNQVLSYKICVDGKKINPSSKGEVDLWRFEDHPTYEERKSRLENEVEILSSSIDKVGRKIEFGHLFLNESSVDLSDNCNISIKILSNRIKDLRLLKVKKDIALSKIESQIKGDWRASGFSYVISSLRTSIYQIEHCIEDLLHSIDKLCQYSAAVSCIDGRRNSFSIDNKVDLAKQENYVCLRSANSEIQTPELIKQRSPVWHEIRNSSLVTGSNINKAIGLEGLKTQKTYLENKGKDKDPEPISADLQHKFDYGTENEINAVANFVSTILPALEPSGSFYEEGCYVHKSDDNTYLVVSPDGSVRTISETVAGIEIKCPMPGKLYTTPVQYVLPHYYIPQVLSEMNSLQVDRLYFISYSKNSTAVHMVKNDETLWNDIVNEIKNLDVKNIPRKLSPNIPKLKKSIKCFQQSNVELVAEVTSKVAKPCTHPDNASGRVCHRNNVLSQRDLLLSDIQKVFIKAKDSLNESNELCAIKATEVLVFVLADLDRIHKPESPNSFPIAYAFKGYSMKSSAMRHMIEQVLYELYFRGIYTPVVSYDGQWASLAFKSKDGSPLTLLELQRRVFNDVKGRKKSDITKVMFETGVMKAEENLLEYIDYTYDGERKTASVSVKSGIKLWKPSKEIRKLFERDKQKEKAKTVHTDARSEENDEIYICSSNRSFTFIRRPFKHITGPEF